MARNRTPRFMNLFSPERRSARTDRWRKRFRKFSLSTWHSSRIVETVCSVFRNGAEAARAVSAATGTQMVSASNSRSLRLEGLEDRRVLDANYWNLAGGDFSQNWSNNGLITVDDDWSAVPSVVGYRGDDITTGTGVNPTTLSGIGPGSGVVDVNANQTNPNTNATGGVAEFHGTSTASFSLTDNFDGYADQAAFQAAWPSIGTTTDTTKQNAQLSTANVVSAPNAVFVPVSTTATSTATEFRNRRSFAETGTLAIGDQLVWSFDFYDSDANAGGTTGSPSNPQRNYANLQDGTAPGSTNQLVSMGLNSNQLRTDSGGQFYMARILGHAQSAMDPNGGPNEAVSGTGSGAYFKLNDFGVGRSFGWHNLKVVISTDDGVSTDYAFYVDGQLAEVVSNVGAAGSLRSYDNIAIGSGFTNGGVNAAFDNMSLQVVPFNGTVALQGSGTADAPYLNVHMDATGRENVAVSFNIRDIDGSLDNAAQQVALQYRVGDTGDYTNVPLSAGSNIHATDATRGPGAATLVTPVTATLPAWANVPDLELRIITTNAIGNDEWVGIDDITVTSAPIVPPVFAPDVYAFSVNENSANGTSIGTVIATDATIGGDTLTYSIASGNASGAFAINPTTGEITVANSAQLDFETVPGGFVLGLLVTDLAGATDTASATISLNDVNDPAIIGGDTTGDVSEDGSLADSGALTITDQDAGQSTFQAAGAATTYGSYTLDASGNWTYTLDNTNAAVQGLITGGTLSDSFTAVSADGTTQLVSITISGADDPAVIGGDASGSVSEDGTLVDNGTLTVTDPDAGQAVFQAAGAATTYGSYTLDAAGNWSYTLDNNNAAVQGLITGGTLSDSFTAVSADGASQLVSITINGADDPAIIGGDATGSVSEDGTLVDSGTLTVTDPDAGQATFVAAAGALAYDSYALDAAGNWSYTLDNTAAAVQGLIAGGTLNDSFTAVSADGATQLVTITIHGADDPAVLGGDATGSVSEDGALVDSGVLTVSDPDAGQAVFQAAGATATYGSYTLDAAGNWSYTLDNSNAAVQGLLTGDTLSDSFTAVSADGATQLITITINGADDPGIIGGDATGTVSEDGTLVDNGALTLSDPDAGQATFQAAGAATTYGSYTLDASGNWTYTLDNNNSAVQNLITGGTLSDSFTAVSADGTTQLVSITIQGLDESSTSIILNGDGDINQLNDVLVIDLAAGTYSLNGNTQPLAGVNDITFFAGAGTDSIVITGGTFGTTVYDYDSATDGDIDLGNGLTLHYFGLDPISNDGTAASAVFNMPASDNDVSVTNSGGSLTVSNASLPTTFENTTIAEPSTSLIVNANAGDDTLTVELSNGYTVTVDGGNHAVGDTLIVDANGAYAIDNGSEVRVQGFANIAYSNFESIVIQNAASAPTTLYVDDSWVGTALDADPDGLGPAINFGIDAFATIQDALNAAAASGTSILVYAGAYNEALSIVGKSLSIADVDGDGTVDVNAGLISTPIAVSGATVVIDGVDVAGGIFGIDLDAADVTVRNSIVSGGSAVGIVVDNGSTLTVEDSTLTGAGLGVGVSVVSGSADISGSILNSRTDGVVIGAGGAATLFNNDLSAAFGNKTIQANPLAGVIDASGNWWGTISEAAIQGKVLGSIDFTPYLNSGANSAPGVGFDGDFSVLHVTRLGDQAGAIGRIQEGVDLVDVGGTVSVHDGVYDETLLVNKTATLQSTNLHGAQIKPTTGSQQTVVRIDAANVTVDGFAIQVNQNDDGSIVGTAPIAPVGIGAVGTVMDGLLLSDNMITSIGNNASVNWTGAPGLTVRAAGIVLNDAPSGGIPSVTLTNNNVSILSGASFFQRAVWLSQLNADITGNTLAGFANDLIFQFASGGPSLIQGNNFVGVHSSGGSGVVIGDPNGGSQIDVIGNNFTPLVSAAPSTSLQVNRNVNGGTSPINIQGNFFTGYTVSGVDVGGAGGVTVSGNTFTPKAGAVGFISVVVDSQNASNNASTASPVDTQIFSNTFNTNGGTGTAILAENNLVGATYAPGGVQIGVGGANTYNGAHTTGVSVTGGVATVTDNITGAGTGLSVSGGTTTLAGSTLTGNTTGVSLSGAGVLTVGAGNAISGATTGMLLSGAGVGLTGLTFNDISIDATGDYITLANSAFDNQDLIATGTTLGGVAVGSMTNAQKFAATNKITDEIDNNSLGLVLLATNTIFVIPVAPGSATPTDNDYTRIKNAIEAAGDNWTIDLLGTFNWVESNAAASWALGNDGLAATADDYSILVAGGLEGVTLTASSGLGTAIIQGPGDLGAVDLEGFLYFPGGSNASDDNKGWAISNLDIRDFDLSIGMFNSGAGVDAFDGTQILNNRIRVATDLNATFAPGDTFQNIGIHYSFGVNQTIQGNFIDIPGDGVSDSANLRFASSVGMQSNTSGGAVYDGLLIDNNTITVLNAQSADPENILGIWENGHAHTSDITVSNNDFVSNALGNNPAANLQRAFRVTSHSGVSNTVTYSNNTVSGANIGFQWIAGSNFAGNQAVQVTGNTLSNVNTGFLIQSNGLANLSGNSLTNSGAMAGVGIGVDVAAGSVVIIDGSVNENTITGFATGIRSAGTVTIDGNDASIHGNVVGVDVTAGTATISNNHIYDNAIGVRFATTGGGSVTNNNFDDGTAGDGLDDNAADLFIAATAGSVAIGAGNDFAGDTFFIDNQSTTSYDLWANGTTFDETNNFRIEDKIHHRVDTDLALSVGLVTWVAGNLFVTAPSSTDSSIQRAIDAAVASNTVNVEAGLYNENLSISKAIKLLGVGAVTLSPSTGGNLVTIDGASFGGDNLVSITNIDFDGLAGLGDVGVRVNNSANFANLTIADSSFTGFDFNAVAVFGNAVTGLSVLDVDITNSTFANNGFGGGGGAGDLQFFEYNGDATLSGLDLVGSATATTGARLGIQFRGTGGATGTGVQAMGDVTLNDVDVSGDYRTQMIGIQRYSDVDDLTFTNVALGGATSAITGTFGASLRFDAVGFGSLATPETFDLGNTLFRGLDPLSAQRHEIEIAPDNLHTFLRVDGTATTWTIGGIDVAASSLSLAQAFAVEDRILHYVDKLNPMHGAYKGFVDVQAGQAFITDNVDAGILGDGSIQRGIEIVVEDGVVNVEAGTFAENLVISKEVNVIGAVNGLGVATTTLTPAGPVGDLIAVSGVIADVGLDGQGVLIQNFNLNGLAGTAGYGVRVQSTTSLNNLTVNNSNFTGFSFNAIAVFGNATTGISVQDVDVTNSTFVDNGIAGGGGSGDLQFFEYNGSATLANLDLSNTGAGLDAHTGIQFRGVGAQNGTGVLAMGAISLTDVDINGLYVRQMIGLQRYTTAGISLNDVRLGGIGSAITGGFGAALRIDAVGGGTFASSTTIDLNDTYFRGVGGLGLDIEIAPDGFGFLRADATDTRWNTTLSTGQTPDNLTLAEQYQLENRILHFVDGTHPNPLFGTFDGFVETVDGNAYITTAQNGSIQRGVDVVDLGGTVNVAAGTYNQSVVVTKNVNLRGAGADVDPELRDLTGALAAETTVSVSGASDVAFHVVNGLTDVTINGFNITGNDTALQGVNGSGHTGLKVLNNFVHDFVSIAVAIETGVTGALVQYNEIFDSYAGVYLATGASAITVGDNYIHDSTSSEGDVTLEGDNQNVTIRNNTLDSATAAGVYVFAAFGSNFAGTTIVDNAFLGAVGVNNTNSATLDADGNWWGSVYGPTSAANPWDGVQPTGASVLGNVTFAPWLTDGTDTAPNVSGFQPNPGDVTAPGATAIDLVTDSGNPTDNVTNDNTPTLAGVTEVGALVDVGVWVDTALNPGVVDDGEVTFVAADEADGSGAWATTLGLLADGTYQFVARVTDLAGNASGWSAPLAVTIDSVITPATTIDLPAIYDSTSTSTIPVGSNSDNITNINTPTLEGAAEAGSTVRIYRNAVLVGTVTATAGDVWSFAPGVLADGPHTFVAEATDLAGNVSNSGPLAVTVDTIGLPSSTPDMTAGTDLGVSNSDNVTNDNTPTFTGTAEAGAFVELMLNGTTVLATGNALGGTWTITAGVAIPNGAHSITARVTDIAGNVSTSPALSITIDTVAPTADGGPDLEYVPSGVPLTITGTAADGLSGVATAEWQFVSSTNGQMVPNSSNPLTFTPIGPGSYSFNFVVTDVAGNVTIDAVAIASTYTADFDLDGDVDGDDLGDWQTGFGTSPNATVGQGDEDRDGDVDGSDFLKWQRQLGSTVVATVAAVGSSAPTSSQSALGAEAAAVSVDAVAEAMESEPSTLQTASWWLESPAISHHRSEAPARSRDSDAAFHDWSAHYDSAASAVAVVDAEDESDEFAAIEDLYQDQDDSEALGNEFDEALLSWLKG